MKVTQLYEKVKEFYQTTLGFGEGGIIDLQDGDYGKNIIKCYFFILTMTAEKSCTISFNRAATTRSIVSVSHSTINFLTKKLKLNVEIAPGFFYDKDGAGNFIIKFELDENA